MRLGGGNGPRIDLEVVGYQFPGMDGDGTGDWDANWLVIAGAAVAEDGRGWAFRDPCLTTWEARRLGDWLRGVVDGSVLPVPFDGGEAECLVDFTEPTLAFSLAERTDDGVVLRVHLSLESRPPWLTEPGHSDLFDYFLLMEMPVARLTHAAQDWGRAVAAHPGR